MSEPQDPWEPKGLISEPFLDPQLLDHLTATTQERKAHPIAFLLVILRRYWAEATSDEADADWRRTSQQNPELAEEILDNLQQLSKDPPPHLATLVVVQARVIFDKEVEGRMQPYDDADYAAWLGRLHSDWTRIYDQERPAG